MDYTSHGLGLQAAAEEGARRTRTSSSPAPPGLFDTRALRDAFGRFATGITIATARAPSGQLAGVTANSFCSVSLKPPLVLWCLSRAAPSQSVFVKATHFAIHVLAEDQAALSARFSRPASDKFAGLALAEGLGRTPLIDGVAALFECRRVNRYNGGDHLIIVGQVERYRHAARAPLVFHSGRYCAVGDL
jgi:flavin reductase (DIM6/NTAB) family NADH-FMN oxidoreductase RutF